MRFFLEFVSCCGSPQNKHEPTTLPTEDEKRWLVPEPPVITSRPRKKRGKRGHEWRPSLDSISEDIMVPMRERTDPCNDAATISTARDVKRRSSRGVGASASKPRQRSYSYGDYGCRGASMPTIMPAFSPTPFMF